LQFKAPDISVATVSSMSHGRRGSGHGVVLQCDGVWIDGDGLGAVVSLIDSNQSVGQLKHVVTQRYYDELRIPRPLL